MKLAACPSRDDLAAFVLGKLPDAAWRSIADHSGQCAHCQKSLHDLDVVSDPLILQIRNRRLQVIAPELLSLLKKAEGIGVQGGSNTLPPGQTLHGNSAQLTQEAKQVLAPPQAADEIGRLGPYRVLKLLGQGGMGMVFLAEDPKLQRTVALKVMLPAVAVNATAKERFLREARATAAIEHDHIVTIHQVDEDRGMPFLAMQLLKGMSLEDFLKKTIETKKPVTLGQILKLGREIAKGLAVAHERGLIHRDIKPANVWLDATAGGRVKILDFGLARPAAADSTITQSGMIVGTPAYMAPEQATGQQIDGRADLFSLGVVLYRLCSGRLPWKGETAMGTLMAVATEDPPTVQELNPRIPPKLAALVMRLLAKKPEARPASANAVVAAIQTIEHEQAALQVKVATPIESAPNQWQQLSQDDVTAPLVTKPMRKHLRRWPLVAALLLAACGLAALSPILIKIKNKDGSETVVQVPTGVTVTVEKDGKVIAQVPPPIGNPVFEQWAEATKKLPAAEQVKAVAAKLQELNPGFDGQLIPTMKQGQVVRLKFLTDQIVDVTPVRALPGLEELSIGASRGIAGRLPGLEALRGLRLKVLNFENNPQCGDLEPLRGMPLVSLNCGNCRVRDLGPLRSMPLQTLSIVTNPITDLSPLRGLALQELWMFSTQVADLTPLTGMPLGHLHIGNALVTDLTILRGLPIHNLAGIKQPERHVELLKSFWSLSRLNERPALDFWKQHDPKHAAFLQWIEDTKKLPAEEQVKAVAAKLKELNPGFDGQVGRDIRAGRVVRLQFLSDRVANITPVRALPDLESLNAQASSGAVGQLPDLEALHGLRLRQLDCARNRQVSGLEPLRGMPLVYLDFRDCRVGDLGPLQGMPLTDLIVAGNPIADLKPLAGMPLQSLQMFSTQVVDLKPLTGLPLTFLDVNSCPVTDLAPLRGMRLGRLSGIKQPERHVELLKSLWALTTLNGQPALDFWKHHDPKHAAFLQWIEDTKKLPAQDQVKAVAAKLVERNPGFDGTVKQEIVSGVVVSFEYDSEHVTDIAPVRALVHLEKLGCMGPWGSKRGLTDLTPLAGMKLKMFTCQGTMVSDLTPLRGLPLTYLNAASTPLADLTPLAGMQLTHLMLHATKVADLSPLKGMALRHLWLEQSLVKDLAPVQGMPLTVLKCLNTPIADLTPLRNAPLLQHLTCDQDLAIRFAAMLRSIKSLETINVKPAAEFWKAVGAGKP